MEFNNSKRMELINTIVTELPVLRARIGASQADISEKIGISRQTYNAIENGKKKLNWTVFLGQSRTKKEQPKCRERGIIKR